MKRFLLLIPAALIAVIISLAPVSISVSNGAHLSSNNASAISMNVYCKSGDSGYTGDTQTAADFCKQFKSTPVDVSNGIYPFRCIKGVFYGTDATVACKAHGGVATGFLCASDNGATMHYGASSAVVCKALGGAYVSDVTVTGPCPNDAKGNPQVAIAIVFPGGSHCVSNDPATGGAIIAYLKVLLKYVASLVGSIVILMIVIGGVQYIVSAGDPTQIKNAKERIINSIIALVLFLSSFAILNFIIPGGLV